MDAHGGTATHDAAPYVATPTVPRTIWAFAWTFVAGQVLQLARVGAKDDADWFISSLLGVAIVTFFAHGVLRARQVRLWVVVVLLVLAAVVELVAVVQEPDGWAVATLLLTATQLYLLNAYVDSPWYRWHRGRPRGGGPPARSILALAVVVGVLAGVIDTDAASTSVNLHMSF